MKIRAYILAGGKSSRMGRDKAMLELGGRTLLARAVEMLRDVAGLSMPGEAIRITIAGERSALEGADRAIADRYPECGPLGGIEAALADLEDEAEWALFIPVDMPLLTADLIDTLLAEWTVQIGLNSSVQVCMVEAEGRVQPLVSLVHRALYSQVLEALDAERYKVAPVLQSGGAYISPIQKNLLPADRAGQTRPRAVTGHGVMDSLGGQESSTPGDRTGVGSRSEDGTAQIQIQFSNVNTEADLIRIATLIGRAGFNR